MSECNRVGNFIHTCKGKGRRRIGKICNHPSNWIVRRSRSWYFMFILFIFSKRVNITLILINVLGTHDRKKMS